MKASIRVRARARVGARVGDEGWAVTVAVSATVPIAVTAPVAVPVTPAVAAAVTASVAATAAALVARLWPVFLGSDPGVLQLGTQPIGDFEVALALGCHPLIQLLLQLPRDRRKAAATAAIATAIAAAIAAAVPTLVAWDDDPGGDLPAEVLPLVVLFGCRLSVLSLVVRDESKALVLAVDVGQLQVLEVSELAKVGTQIVLASVKRKPSDEQLAALVVGHRRGVAHAAPMCDVACARVRKW